MVNNKYGIAYSEILEILKYIPIEDYNKIPKSEIELFKTYADNNHTFTYDTTKTLAEQNVSDITKGLIILLFRDYWATEVQRNKIIAKQNYDRIKLEEEKEAKYNSYKALDNNYKNSSVNNEKSNQKSALIELKNMKWYEKIWKSIKKFFSKMENL